MKKQRNNQGFAEGSANQDVFADFNPPSTTDGSYMGTMKRAKATEAHLERKFQERLEEVKARLKASKCKVGVSVRGGAIQLQATLPPKPDSDKVKPYQQLISLSIPASLDGLKTAEEEANELGRLLARKQFEWNEKYLGNKIEEVVVPTIGELLDKFEIEYFKTRKKTMKSQYTIDRYKKCIRSNFDSDKIYSKHLIEQKMLELDGGARQNLKTAIGVFSKIFKLNIDFSILPKNTNKPKERYIPNDEKIINGYHKYFDYSQLIDHSEKATYKNQWKIHRWCYGMLATYGLRPKELFINPDIEWWLSPENTDNTWKVHKDCKTGEREAFPLHQEWVKTFDLKNGECTELLKQLIQGKTRHSSFASLVTVNAKWFQKIKVGFQPYNLRHAWAIRAHMMGVPVKAAADNLGHSVDMHTSTYQRWFGRENRKIVINAAIAKKSEVDLLREENVQLKLEVDRLKIEVERYRLMNTEIEY